MQRTKIEYLTHTWNPIAMRCSPVSAGCANCWHLRTADRISKNPKLGKDKRLAYAGGSGYEQTGPILLEDELSAPFRLRGTARIGVQFMGDLFHESVPDEWIADILTRCVEDARHTYVILTKRIDRVAQAARWSNGEELPPHVWLGVSVEDQATADERIPTLLDIPAAVRWVSYEPALGALDLSTQHRNPEWPCSESLIFGLDWVVAGAETGPKKRPVDNDWLRGVRDECAEARVPFFFKQDSTGSRKLDGRLHEDLP